MVVRSAVSTIDNPYSPFDDFPAWYAYDTTAGYHTAELVGRILATSHQLSDADYDLAMEQTVDEIVKENISGMFIKVQKEFPDDEEFIS